MHLRHSRAVSVGVGGDEGESLLMAPSTQLVPQAVVKKPTETDDPLDQLPKHLADALRR